MPTSCIDQDDDARLAAGRRVLLVTQASAGGVGRHFLDLAERLQRRGVDVVGVYSPRKLDQVFRDRLASPGIPPMHALHMRRGIHPMDFTEYRALLALAREHGPFDLVHGHSSKGGALARLVGHRLGVANVYTPHAMITQDPELGPFERRVYTRIERWLAGRTHAIIAVSNDEAEHIRTLGIPADKVHVVLNGIDPPDFPARASIRRRLEVEDTDVVIGFVGRLARQKDPLGMLDAYAAAFGDRPDVRLVMIGDGPLDQAVARRVQQMTTVRPPHLLGEADALDWMAGFDIFALSSTYEGLPYVLLEALAAGLPIVSTRVGGATMCVEHDRNGLLVPPRDPPALGRALRRLVDDADLRARMSAHARRMADALTIESMTQRTLEVYRHVWDSAGNGPAPPPVRATPSASRA